VLNEPLTGSLTTPLQYGLAAALAVEDAADRREALRGRWALAHEILAEAGLEAGQPQGGLFYFVDISGAGLDAEEFADELLQHEHVAVVPGNSFGLRLVEAGGQPAFTASSLARRYVRLCFAVPEDRLRQGLKRLAAFYHDRAGTVAG
jgi:aminotransferase